MRRGKITIDDLLFAILEGVSRVVNCIERGCPLGDEKRMGATIEKLGLQMTLRLRGRSRKSTPDTFNSH